MADWRIRSYGVRDTRADKRPGAMQPAVQLRRIVLEVRVAALCDKCRLAHHHDARQAQVGQQRVGHNGGMLDAMPTTTPRRPRRTNRIQRNSHFGFACRVDRNQPTGQLRGSYMSSHFGRVARRLIDHHLDWPELHQRVRWSAGPRHVRPAHDPRQHEDAHAERAGIGQPMEQLPIVDIVRARCVLHGRHAPCEELVRSQSDVFGQVRLERTVQFFMQQVGGVVEPSRRIARERGRAPLRGAP